MEDMKFTQEDLDRIVSERLNREKSKYADYDIVKSELESLKTFKSQYEETQKTETEKAIARAVKAREDELKSSYEQEIGSLKAQTVRSDFLNKQDKKLPSAYLNQIKLSTDIAEVEASFKEVMKVFEADMKALGLQGRDIGGPSNPNDKTVTNDWKTMTYKEKEELFKVSPELYRKLRDEAK